MANEQISLVSIVVLGLSSGAIAVWSARDQGRKTALCEFSAQVNGLRLFKPV